MNLKFVPFLFASFLLLSISEAVGSESHLPAITLQHTDCCSTQQDRPAGASRAGQVAVSPARVHP